MAQAENTTELVLCPWQREGAEITIAGQVTDPAGTVHTLWFRVPASEEGALTTSADPFVIGFLFPCMHWNRPVRIRGTASPSLLANLELLSAVWHQRWPDLYQSIRFVADEEREAVPAGGAAEGMGCFSGGVDSCYVFWRHYKRLIGRRSLELKAGFIVHGFVDLPLDQPEIFAQAYQRCRAMLESVGSAAIPVATNAARDLPMPGRHTWAIAHGTTIGAVLQLFSRRCHHGLIANTFPYTMLRNEYGTSPLTDHLMSSASLSVRDDGGEAVRLQKMAAIVDWPAAMANLRVCNEGIAGGNCGVCEKCLRTIVALRLYCETQPAAFPEPVTNHQIRHIQLRYPSRFHYWENILHEAAARGMADTDWAHAIETAIRRSRLRLFRKSVTDPILKLFHHRKEAPR
jgi:hypothetical protein